MLPVTIRDHSPISLLIGGIGAFIEQCAEKKDREINISLDSKTWIINNGQIVISDEQTLREKLTGQEKYTDDPQLSNFGNYYILLSLFILFSIAFAIYLKYRGTQKAIDRYGFYPSENFHCLS